MPLSAGMRLGPYAIVAPLGAGGMGEVYRATDTKLGRQVAIKVLSETFANDAERMARFEREAKLLASLNHPNIAAIYGVEGRALVMELVEGAMPLGPLPLETALDYARQIAEALEAAHEKGIIHRDLKPANVLVTPEGVVKVLDFGLAKAAEDTGAGRDPAMSPTLTIGGTRAGMIMGTAAYMSPEQAHGKAADRRADIWSFGIVLYEMLAGKQAFQGESVSDTLASVLKSEPDWDALPAATPPSIRRLLRQCLRKDRKWRLQAIGDARIALEEYAAEPEPEAAALASQRRPLPWMIATGALAVLAAGALWAPWRAARTIAHPMMRLSVGLGPDAVAGTNTTAAISPDGTRLVFPVGGPDGIPQLATRLLDQSGTALLAGTENAADPFFSPDGRWIGFFAGGKMKKIAVQGGAPVTLCDATTARGGTWGEDGNIIATLNAVGGLARVPAAGGTPQPLTKPAERGDLTDRWPQVLPGGQAVVFTASATTNFEEASIEVVSLKTGQWKRVLRGGYFGRYLPSGHLVYIHQGTLFGVPFDPDRLELRGSPAPLLEDAASNATMAAGQFDFSQTGTFVYLSGKSSDQTPVVWLDSTGKMQPLLSRPGSYLTPRLSPDGNRLVLSGVPAAPSDLWIYDWQRDTMSRLTFTGQGSRFPVWTPDGKRVAFTSQTGGGSIIWWMRADGAGEAQRLMESKDILESDSFSPDGRRLAFTELSPETGFDLWTLPLDTSDPDHPKPGKPEVFLRTPSNERSPAFSPDGHWIAYQSLESGSDEVYVRSFPGPGGKWQVSTGGGQFPIWSRDGRKLFYESPDNRIMVADYAAKGDSFDAGRPRLWSGQQLYPTGLFSNLDLSPDGKRFVVYPRSETAGERKGSVRVTFLLNFFDEVRRRMPPGGR